MATTADNPAARLLVLIRGLRFYDNSNRSAIEAWRGVLQIGPGNDLRLLERFGRAAQLPIHAKAAVEDLTDINSELYLRWYSKVEAAFMLPLATSAIAQFFKIVDSTVELGVEMCADLLSRSLPERIISDENLKAIQKDFAELREEVFTDPSIPLSLKKLILYHINEILKAISDYDITGSQPLEHAVENAVGSVFLHPEIREKLTQSEVGKRFGQKLKTAAKILLLLHSLLQLPNDLNSDFNSVRHLFLETREEPAIEVEYRPETATVESAADSARKSKSKSGPEST